MIRWMLGWVLDASWIDFWWILGPFWEASWHQNGTKIQKNGAPKRCRKMNGQIELREKREKSAKWERGGGL